VRNDPAKLAERLAVAKQDAQVARNLINSIIERMVDIEVDLRAQNGSGGVK
jgi:hypothetical protein